MIAMAAMIAMTVMIAMIAMIATIAMHHLGGDAALTCGAWDAPC